MIGTRCSSKFVLRELKKDKSQSYSNVVLALLSKRTSKERRKGNPPTPDNLSLYTLCLPPSNHSSCSDVPSEYPTLIVDTTNTTHIDTITPHPPTSQHLRPLPYHNKLYCHHPEAPSLRSRVSRHLCLSVTLIRSASPILFLYTPQPITPNPSRDNDVPFRRLR